MLKQLLTPNEATVLVAMPGRMRRTIPPSLCTEYFLVKGANLPYKLVVTCLCRLLASGLVERASCVGDEWRLTSHGERRRAELLGFEQAVAKLNESGDRLLAEADCRPGPSRAMYPASVLQGRGG